MRGTMKAGVLLSLMLLLALAGPALAAAAGGLPIRESTRDCPFPVSVDPICGIQITVYGSKPVNFYGGTRMPASWLPPVDRGDPAGLRKLDDHLRE